MKAFVTGGAGFIGSNLVDALVDRGDDVVALDDLSTGRESNLEGALARGAVLHRADIRDGERLAALVTDAAPDVIFHLAAQIDVRRAVADPAFDAQVNVVGTINVLEAARRAGVPRVVNSSTGGAIYGDAATIPTPEDHVAAPMAPYGQSKLAAEGYLGLYSRLYGMSSASLRYANVYGPRQDPHGEGGVVAIFCGKLAEGGTPTAFGDGRQTRDYTYVGDVVAANLAAAASGWEGPCNIGTGTETSVIELAAALRAFGDGAPFELEHAPERTGEIIRSAVDPALAREVLGWQAQVGLSEGLERTLAGVRG
ncbi:MAG TPA: NAD-dependent epimerase/dehydratase family protein [Solirubrobacteraceae bacterium]|nr:NAD-dependent epimerase/dehydratase family protein [Solirubrobacteraceae bacterium]